MNLGWRSAAADREIDRRRGLDRPHQPHRLHWIGHRLPVDLSQQLAVLQTELFEYRPRRDFWEIKKPHFTLTKCGNARICQMNAAGFCIVCATSAQLASNFPRPRFLSSSLLSPSLLLS